MAKRKAPGRTKSVIERDRIRRRHVNNRRYAARHPEPAKTERALRKAQERIDRDWKHKNDGTPETHDKASRKRQGALARLYQSGAITIDQLAWAIEIAGVHDRIGADVSVRTVSMETHIDGGGGSGVFWEALGAVRREIAYSRWRLQLPGPATPILAMICDDIGVTIAARRHGMGVKRAKRLLIAAIDMWPELLADARRQVDAADLAAAQAGLT